MRDGLILAFLSPSAISLILSVVRGWHPFSRRAAAVQQTDTIIEDRRGRLIAELERKFEQAKKNIAARDARIAELMFQVGRLQTLLFEALDNNRSTGRVP